MACKPFFFSIVVDVVTGLEREHAFCQLFYGDFVLMCEVIEGLRNS